MKILQKQKRLFGSYLCRRFVFVQSND